MIPIHAFRDKTVALFGLGLSGIASARALMAGGAAVAAWDDSQVSREAAREHGIPLVNLGDADWSEFDALVLAPGVPLTHPEPHWTVRKAHDSNLEIIGDTELFFRERERLGSRARVIAITGTNGKSTTTALTAHVLMNAGLNAVYGGNIGTAILDLPPLYDDMIYVIEFSSYQIDLTPTLKANASALLNISADHLDRHGSLENYAAIKARIFSSLPDDGTAVIGVDDELCRSISQQLNGPFEVVQVSVHQPLDNGVTAISGELLVRENGTELARVDLTGIGSLRGEHNAQNAAVAYALARSIGVDAGAIEQGLRSFPGLEHRMEEVGRMGRVVFINDSKGTNADAAAHALASFEEIYWIAGGLAKTGGIAGLSEYFPRIAHAYLIGEAAKEFAKTLDGKVPYTVCGTLERTVTEAAAAAAESDGEEPAVLLSPACASFDQFRSFAVRGEAFKRAVGALDGIDLRQGAKT